jgi:hypothetical protein
MAPPTPIPIASGREPGPTDRDILGRCWWGQPAAIRRGQFLAPCWFLADEPEDSDTHWLAYGDLPLIRGDHEPEDFEPDDNWQDHPSLTAADRNPSLCAR